MKSYCEGGLTFGQIFHLYDKLIEDKKNEMEAKHHEFEFHASIHGAKMKKQPSRSNEPLQQPKNQELPIFQSPEAYAKMTEEERAKATEKMMGMHKQWAGQNKHLGK